MWKFKPKWVRSVHHIEFLSPHSLHSCAGYMKEWEYWENKVKNPGSDKLTVHVTPISDKSYSIYISHRQNTDRAGKTYLWIEGELREQDTNTTLIVAEVMLRTQDAVTVMFLTLIVFPVIALIYYTYFVAEPRQLADRLESVFTNPHLGGVRGFHTLSRTHKSAEKII